MPGKVGRITVERQRNDGGLSIPTPEAHKTDKGEMSHGFRSLCTNCDIYARLNNYKAKGETR